MMMFEILFSLVVRFTVNLFCMALFPVCQFGIVIETMMSVCFAQASILSPKITSQFNFLK